MTDVLSTPNGTNTPQFGGGTGDSVSLERSSVRRILTNTAFPFVATLVARVLSWVTAVIMARTIGPDGTGAYAIAVNIWLYAGIVADFGLGTWVTREVALRRGTPQEAQVIVARILGLRVLFAGIAAIILGASAIIGVATGSVESDLAGTIGLLALSLLPGAIASAASAIFAAHERMTTPAIMQVVGATATTLLGSVALVNGGGVIGLGVVSFVVTSATALAFAWLAARAFFPMRMAWPGRHSIRLASESLPLMFNNLLNNLFFRIDVQILGASGRTTVGQYTSAYKVIDGVGGISSSFVLALFPILARRASDRDQESLGRIYRLSLTLLVALALPIAGLLTWVATPLSDALWGPAFLPESATALQILIWFLPLSYINGLTQYVLIALGLQSRITMAFAVAAVFNLVANVILIPRYGYVSAAAVTIATEALLLVPFLHAMSSRFAVRPILIACLRPVPGACVAAIIVVVGTTIAPAAAVVVAAIAYPLALWRTGVVSDDDRRMLTSIWRRGL